MTDLYVDLELAMSPEALPHCEAAIDSYLAEAYIEEPARTELQNLRNTFRAMDQQVRAGYRKAVDLTLDPLLR